MDSFKDIKSTDQPKVSFKPKSSRPNSDTTKCNFQSKLDSNAGGSNNNNKRKSVGSSSNPNSTSRHTSRQSESKHQIQSTSLLPRKTIIIVSLILFIFTFLAAFSVYSPLIGKTYSIFNTDILNVHNIIRRRHFETADLDIDDKLISAAQNWVDHLSAINYNGTGPFPREPHSIYGENLFFSKRKNPDADQIIHSFIHGEKFYNYENAEPNPRFYNFTQVIWKGTKKVGCAFNLDRNLYVSCKYHPAGNQPGQFLDNVKKPIAY